MWDQIAGVENAGLENSGPNRTGKKAGLENAGPNFQGGKRTTTVELEMDKYKVKRNII